MSATTAWQTDSSVQAGVQAFLRMSRQISPVCGWGYGFGCGVKAFLKMSRQFLPV